VTRSATNAAFDVLRDSTLRGEISLAVGIRHRVESGVLIDSPTRSIQTIMLVCRIMLWRNHFTPSMESLMIRPACHSLPQQPSRPLGYRGLSSLPRVISTDQRSPLLPSSRVPLIARPQSVSGPSADIDTNTL
jgi:hypothetical protein